LYLHDWSADFLDAVSGLRDLTLKLLDAMQQPKAAAKGLKDSQLRQNGKTLKQKHTLTHLKHARLHVKH